jgi:hypothetical protein
MHHGERNASHIHDNRIGETVGECQMLEHQNAYSGGDIRRLKLL